MSDKQDTGPEISIPNYKIDDVIQTGARSASVTPETEATDLGQIPAMITMTEHPALTQARSALLKAIGQEAQHVADKHQGQASKQLEELARAYALVTAGAPAVVAGTPAIGARSAEGRHSISLVAHVPYDGSYVAPIDPGLVNKDQGMNSGPTTGDMNGMFDVRATDGRVRALGE